MKNIKKLRAILLLFSIITFLWFIYQFVRDTIAVIRRGAIVLNPYYLNEINWSRLIVNAIIFGILLVIFRERIHNKEREGENVNSNLDEDIYIDLPKSIRKLVPRSFTLTILLNMLLFLCFLMIMAVREYIVRDLGVTFLQFCGTEVPWLDILKTSFIMGVIIAIGVYNPFNDTE